MVPDRFRSLRHRAARAALVCLASALLTAPAAASPAARVSITGTARGSATTEPQQGRTSRKPTGQRSRPTRRRTTRTAAAPAPAPRWTTPRGLTALSSDLGAMLGSRVHAGTWGVLVVSLTRGDTLYSFNADAGLQPASNMKLFTAALALDQLGPSHRFSTDVLRDGALGGDGTILGNLILRGDGDPGLSGRFLNGGASAPMDTLAERVAAAGVRQVRGDLIADATAFDAQRIPDGWQSRYLQASYAARVSALSLNENLAWVVVAPGASKSSALVSMDPPSDIPVANKARTVAGRSARIVVLPTAGGYEVRGWIGASAGTQRYQVVVEDPAAFAASAFRRALARRGVTVNGAIRFDSTPASALKVATLESPPLSRLLSVMNRESINHYAELLFRGAGRHGSPSHIGSRDTGSDLLQRLMTDKVGAAPDAVYAADGSGLSVNDRVTPRSLVQLLDYAHKAPWADAFHASLPVAGESELLRYRMRATPAQGNLHAKTGTTNSVISLGGYVTAEDGELIAFAFIYNGSDRWNAKTTIDQMGATLAGFGR
ncbi:MAG: D-alanyl-D-alanine carboxypeptidase/D-alanyl-D-alanine-endopeptidase [Gemmatimonadaceae bacterium]